MALDLLPRKITVSEYHRMAEVGIQLAAERFLLPRDPALDSSLIP